MIQFLVARNPILSDLIRFFVPVCIPPPFASVYIHTVLQELS